MPSRLGLCCICLSLQDLESPRSFQKMTYKSFSSMERSRALEILGGRILNNIEVTAEAVRYCADNGLCYRLSSDLFPLLTYDKAELKVEDLPNHDRLQSAISDLKTCIAASDVRISTHPDQFNVLASENPDAVNKTIRELNFQSWFMDQIGCPADYRSPINLHINSNSGGREKIVDRLLANMDRLDDNCRNRIVFENDDKQACWSVRLLIDHLHPRTGVPLTFDYLHHKCHPDGMSEADAVSLCHASWGNFTPLFHYSESKDDKNPRAHADYPSSTPETYGFDFDLDFEFKMKEKAIALYESRIQETLA